MEGIFDPRPETEGLVEIAKELVKELGLNFFTYLDLCSGTGAIFVSLLLELGDKISCSAGVDISARACQNILKNLSWLEVKGNHRVYLSNWESFLDKNSQWEVITMNPPYLSYEELNQQLKYDPRGSLVAKQQGLSHYKKLLEYLRKNIYWKSVILECSEFHEDFWEQIEKDNTSWTIKRYRDYLGKFRIVSIVRS